MNNLLCQTYSRNKGGLKLFHFREYGPNCSIYGVGFLSYKLKRLTVSCACATKYAIVTKGFCDDCNMVEF